MTIDTTTIVICTAIRAIFEIDLDDGAKVNYAEFADVLAKIK